MKSKNWLYQNTPDNLHRFSLGICTNPPLLCIGVNPSTATPERLDPTLKSVIRISQANQYDGWIMANLYPQRATKPNDMDLVINEEMHQQNLRTIDQLISNYNIREIWAVWGTLITKRDYLKSCLQQLYAVSQKHNCTWITYGALCIDWHPRHPLYLKTNSEKTLFDIDNYLKRL